MSAAHKKRAPYVCPIKNCGIEFSSFALQKQHSLSIKGHNQNNPTKYLPNGVLCQFNSKHFCPLCYQVYDTKLECHTHIKQEHSACRWDKPILLAGYLCLHCWFIFDTKDRCDEHVNQIKPPATFPLPFRGGLYSIPIASKIIAAIQEKLEQHLELHCSACERRISSDEQMAEHVGHPVFSVSTKLVKDIVRENFFFDDMCIDCDALVVDFQDGQVHVCENGVLGTVVPTVFNDVRKYFCLLVRIVDDRSLEMMNQSIHNLSLDLTTVPKHTMKCRKGPLLKRTQLSGGVVNEGHIEVIDLCDSSGESSADEGDVIVTAVIKSAKHQENEILLPSTNKKLVPKSVTNSMTSSCSNSMETCDSKSVTSLDTKSVTTPDTNSVTSTETSSVAKSVTIEKSVPNSVAKSVTNSMAKSVTNSMAKSVTNSMEKSVTATKSVTNSVLKSVTAAKSVTNSVAKSCATSKAQPQVWPQPRCQVWSQVWRQKRPLVWHQNRPLVWNQNRTQIWHQNRPQVWQHNQPQVWLHDRPQFWQQDRPQVWQQDRPQIRSVVTITSKSAAKALASQQDPISQNSFRPNSLAIPKKFDFSSPKRDITTKRPYTFKTQGHSVLSPACTRLKDKYRHLRMRKNNSRVQSRYQPGLVAITNLSIKQSIIFLDLDNWPSFFRRLDRYLPDGVFVWGFFGGCKVWTEPSRCPKFDHLQQCRNFYLHAQCSRRKNSADFAIVLNLGIMHEKLPKSIVFMIVSGDYGFSEVIDEIKESGRRVELINPHHRKQGELSEIISQSLR